MGARETARLPFYMPRFATFDATGPQICRAAATCSDPLLHSGGSPSAAATALTSSSRGAESAQRDAAAAEAAAARRVRPGNAPGIASAAALRRRDADVGFPRHGRHGKAFLHSAGIQGTRAVAVAGQERGACIAAGAKR